MTDDIIFVNPFELAQLKHKLEGTLPIMTLSRITNLLSLSTDQSSTGKVNYIINFYFDKHEFCVISGKLFISYITMCERCLQIFTQDLESVFKVSPIKSEIEIKNLSKDYDPVIINKNYKLDVPNLIEEECILAMPIVFKHYINAKECIKIKDVNEQPIKHMNNPFIKYFNKKKK